MTTSHPAVCREALVPAAAIGLALVLIAAVAADGAASQPGLPRSVAQLAVQGPAPAGRALITGIRVNTGASGEERLVFAVRSVPVPKVFFIEGDPVRLVCDFMEADLAAGVPAAIRPGGKMIRQVRLGVHSEPERKVRVVLDLTPGRDYEIDEYFRPEEAIYELIVRPAGGAAPLGDG